MRVESVIAFPETDLRGKNLEGLQTTRLRVNGEIFVGIPISQLEKVCEMLGTTKRKISQVKTDYQGVYLARLSQDSMVRTSESVDVKTNLGSVLRRKYMELCGYNRKAECVRDLKEEIAKLHSDIEKCQSQLIIMLRKLEEKQQQLQVVAGTDEALLSRFGDEFDQLMKHPDLEKIEIDGKKIVVYTAPINISYQRVNYDIGRFKITINTVGAESPVRMVNLTRTASNDWGNRGYHHPHIDTYGVPCLGNIQEVIPHMIAEHKYAAVVSVCIQYLKSYENSDWYRPYASIENWPVVEIKTKKGSKK